MRVADVDIPKLELRRLEDSAQLVLLGQQHLIEGFLRPPHRLFRLGTLDGPRRVFYGINDPDKRQTRRKQQGVAFHQIFQNFGPGFFLADVDRPERRFRPLLRRILGGQQRPHDVLVHHLRVGHAVHVSDDHRLRAARHPNPANQNVGVFAHFRLQAAIGDLDVRLIGVG